MGGFVSEREREEEEEEEEEKSMVEASSEEGALTKDSPLVSNFCSKRTRSSHIKVISNYCNIFGSYFFCY